MALRRRRQRSKQQTCDSFSSQSKTQFVNRNSDFFIRAKLNGIYCPLRYNRPCVISTVHDVRGGSNNVAIVKRPFDGASSAVLRQNSRMHIENTEARSPERGIANQLEAAAVHRDIIL